MDYKHTQFSYLMLVVTLAVLVLFTWVCITGSAERDSPDSGPNFAITFCNGTNSVCSCFLCVTCK